MLPLTDLPTTNSSFSLFLALLLLLPPAALLIYRDYHAFINLGAGGTPQTLAGYLRIKFLSLFALRTPRCPAPIPSDLRQSGYLVPSTLPARAGPRPEVVGIAPHRQKTQWAPPEAFETLAARLREMAADPRNRLVEGTSCFEKHGTGLFSLSPLTRTCRGEVCHVHGSDGSLHMTLYPADAKLVIEKGWAERHPIARGGFFARFVPKHFVMVYAPRNEEEAEIVARIVGAAVWWVSGICVGKEGMRDDRARSEADDRMVDTVREMEGQLDLQGKAVPEGFCLGCRQKQLPRLQSLS